MDLQTYLVISWLGTLIIVLLGWEYQRRKGTLEKNEVDLGVFAVVTAPLMLVPIVLAIAGVLALFGMVSEFIFRKLNKKGK